MNKLQFIAGAICLVLLSCSEHPQDDPEQLNNSPVLKIGERITVPSQVLHEDRDIWVYLPQNYNDKYFQESTYPVLYILDGNVHFFSISGMMQILGSGMNGVFVIPEMIVVAIPNTDRTRDLTPTHSLKDNEGNDQESLSSSGGGDQFLRFMTDELIPRIDSSYRTFPYRIMAGHSFGGIETIYAMVTSPETFNAYIAIDPSLWWDDGKLLDQGKNYLDTAVLKGKSFFLAQANTLWVEDTVVNKHFQRIKEFGGILESDHRSGLRAQYRYYENDNHGSVAFAAEYDALRFIFQDYYANFGTITTPEVLKEHYKNFSDQVNVTFPPPERVVQQFGSIASYRGKKALAEKYFQMNIDNYPQSSSAYANMGELLNSNGDKKKALEYYEKSVAIFPENEDSNNNIRRLREELK